jgi:DNA-binding PadR family transcriptional regulator
MTTLGYAILGLVATKPRTGYEIAQLMRKPIGYMWTAQHSQIYPELARLADTGLLRPTVIKGRGPRDTKRYTITAAGRRALQAWVDSPLVETARSGLLLRIRSLWLVSPTRAQAFLAEQRQRYADRLATYHDEELNFATHATELSDPTTPAFCEYATLRYGITRVRATITWLDWLSDQLTAATQERATTSRTLDRSATSGT